MSEKKAKKSKKPLIIAVAALVLVIGGLLYYGFVYTKAGYWLLAKFQGDTEEQALAYVSATESVRQIAEGSFVLVKNDDGLLPLKTSADDKLPVNLFGTRAIQIMYNGGGSTATDPSRCTKLEDALNGEYGNFSVNPELLYLYYNYYQKGKVSAQACDAPENGGASEFMDAPLKLSLPELPASVYSDTSLMSDGKSVIDSAKAYSDIAIVVIGRGAGEGRDLQPVDLRLNADEKDMLDNVCAAFDNVVLIVNSANTMELGFIENYPSIKSVLWIGYPGEAGNLAVAEILNGTVNPSGRLADTWLYDNAYTLAANNYIVPNADGTWSDDHYHYVNIPNGFAQAIDKEESELGFFNQYSESIFVGYKYFETRHDTDPSYNYDSEVLYPFGYGLSYTTFEKNIASMEVSDGKVNVRVGVRNNGDVAGRDVIEIYYNPPYTGAIEKSTVNLVTFMKTNEIQPGDIEYYTLTFNVEDMASYDAVNHGCYVLEAGDYIISLRADAHTVLDEKTYTQTGDVVYDEASGGRSSDLQTAVNQFDDMRGVDDYATRQWDWTGRAFTGPRPEDYTAPENVVKTMGDYVIPTDAELGVTEMPAVGQKLAATIKLSELVDVPFNDTQWDAFISQLTIDEMAALVGGAAYRIDGIDRLGVPSMLMPDGPSAIAANMFSGAIMGTDKSGVTYPSPVVVASSWDPSMAKLMGTSVGNEANALGYSGWYAPAMNIHRTAYIGRNFEYYSEDAVLSGTIAASVINGASEQGIMCFIKHFAMNERCIDCRNRFAVWADEQTVREIYLKPFEICVKTAHPNAVMSSFVYMGDTWCGANDALLNQVLRNEWGFEGFVITDAHYNHMHPIWEIHNGGDMALDAMSVWLNLEDSPTSTLKAAANNPATEKSVAISLQRAAKNILFAVSRTESAMVNAK